MSARAGRAPRLVTDAGSQRLAVPVLPGRAALSYFTAVFSSPRVFVPLGVQENQETAAPAFPQVSSSLSFRIFIGFQPEDQKERD